MFRKITIVAAALAVTAALGVAAGPASAARSMNYSSDDTTFSAPTGTHTMSADKNPPMKYISGTDDDGCQGQADAANSWIDAALEAWYRDDSVAQAQAQHNADAIAGEANADGCTLYD